MNERHPTLDEKKPAGLGRRLAAGTIDLAVCVLLYVLLYLGVIRLLDHFESELLFDLFWQVIPGFFAFSLLYVLILEASPLRATAGKLLLGLRVRDPRGGRAGVVRVLVRGVLKLLTIPTLGIAFFLCAFRKDRRTLYDHIAGCSVLQIKRRRPSRTPVPPAEKAEGDKLIAKGLEKIYGGRRVVDNVDLEIRPGEVVGLLGPNGAGKTTTFYMIVGLIKPDRGHILLDGEDVSASPMYVRARKGLNYLPQEPSIFRKLTVEENILAILETLDLNKQERRERLKDLLGELDLTPLAHNRAYSLSGGERRRVEITRALVTSPKYILLDEPFAGIDPLAVADIQAIIGKLKDKGIGIVISDHNVRETLSVCDRAYILNEGAILIEGDPLAISQSEIARKIYFGEDFELTTKGTKNLSVP